MFPFFTDDDIGLWAPLFDAMIAAAELDDAMAKAAKLPTSHHNPTVSSSQPKPPKQDKPARVRAEKPLTVRNVVFKGRDTIVYWGDGTKTVATRSKAEPFDAEKGIMAATLKKYINDDTSLNDFLRYWVKHGKRFPEKRTKDIF